MSVLTRNFLDVTSIIYIHQSKPALDHGDTMLADMNNQRYLPTGLGIKKTASMICSSRPFREMATFNPMTESSDKFLYSYTSSQVLEELS